MRNAIFAAITCCAIAGIATGADTTPQKKAPTPAKKAAPTAAVRKGVAPSSGSATKSGAKPATSTAGARTPAKTSTKTASKRYYSRQPVRRSYSAQQISPTADRYREIQDALASKGYLKTPSTGVWDKDSVDAMQRFQQDQKLEPTGKLTARSLGALGLGPKPPVESSSPAHPAPGGGANSGGEASPLQ
jgi:hypothetical protein